MLLENDEIFIECVFTLSKYSLVYVIFIFVKYEGGLKVNAKIKVVNWDWSHKLRRK